VNGELTFMQQTMVFGTDHHRIGQAGFITVHPMLYMV